MASATDRLHWVVVGLLLLAPTAAVGQHVEVALLGGAHRQTPGAFHR